MNIKNVLIEFCTFSKYGEIMKRISISLIVVCLTLFSCSKKSNQIHIEVVNGITYIHNTEIPSNMNKTVVFKEELTITGRNEEDEIILFQPGIFRVDNKGNIFITDESDQSIKVFDRTGKYQRTIGTRGSGPGEFQIISDMFILPDGKLIVTDNQNMRTIIFNRESEFINSYRWDNRHYYIYLASDTTYTISENIRDEREHLFVKKYDYSGNVQFVYGEFKLANPTKFPVDNMIFYMYPPYSPRSIIVGDSKKDWLFHCINDVYKIEVYDHNGELFRIIDRPYKPVQFTKKDADIYLSRFKKNNPRQKFAKQIVFPKKKTVTNRMIIDDLGNLWVETFEKMEKDDHTFTAYDIFNNDGVYDTRVWSSIRPGIFVNGKMYLLGTEEETGLKSLIRYHVQWKENGNE